jgi:broad specificity phosphatase PhoE
MKHLYFCRHGESELNKAGVFAGLTDTPLTDEGREQARLEGLNARDHGIDLIVCSPLSRALETAQIIATQLKIEHPAILQNELLIERDFGELEGTPYDPSVKIPVHPSVESDEAIIARARKAAAWLETLPSETILVVAHGSLGRALRFVYQPDVDFEKRIPNAEIMKLL